jgi:soluble lytic murein transglycosylase-like protein
MNTTLKRTALAVVFPCLVLAGCNTLEGATAHADPSVAQPDGANDSAVQPAKGGKRGSARIAASPAEASGLKAIVKRHAEANGVPFALAHAVVMVESRYRPTASNAGNYGLMQIRLQTARGVGYQGDARGLLNPDTNARYAMKYLGQAHKMAGGDICRTIMKYQSGHMAFRMSGANRTYCSKVRVHMAQA